MRKPTIHSLHKEHYIFQHTDPVVLVLQYDYAIKCWKFTRYSCKLCHSNFKALERYLNHHKTCKVLNTSKKKKKD